MRFLLRAIFWLAVAYALIPSRAPVPASLKAAAPPEQAQAEATGNGNTSTGLARDAITLCLDNPKACATGVEAVSKVAEMARAAGARFTDSEPEAVVRPAGTTPAATTPAASPSPATRATHVPLPQDRPGSGR